MDNSHNVDMLREALPTGSGFDSPWEVTEHRNRYKACGAYHTMNDGGYYDGWCAFSVIIPKTRPHDFRLHFHGRCSHYLARKYVLRDYLEDCIADVIDMLWKNREPDKRLKFLGVFCECCGETWTKKTPGYTEALQQAGYYRRPPCMPGTEYKIVFDCPSCIGEDHEN